MTWLVSAGGDEPLGIGQRSPKVREGTDITIGGLEIGNHVTIGRWVCEVEADGTAILRSSEPGSDSIGYVQVVVDGVLVGEVERIPSKITDEQYEQLRSDLIRTWTGLIFDDEAAVTIDVPSPPAESFWHRIGTHVYDIIERPAERLEVTTGVRYPEKAKHPREITAAMLRAEDLGTSALTRVVERTSAIEENHLVGTTLRMLRDRARKDASQGDLERQLNELLANPMFTRSHEHLTTVTWGMRSDHRYSEILAVYFELLESQPEMTEGPAELREGVKALPRLYEYWVYLQVLLAARQRFGDPLGDGFASLSAPVEGKRRLELARGTEVEFPGGVVIGFEPEISASQSGWRGLRLALLEAGRPVKACPDVVVLRQLEDKVAAVVIDAKYTFSQRVRTAALEVHDKYAHFVFDGVPAVRHVTVAHPQENQSRLWAGYGYQSFVPGQPVELDSLFDLLGPEEAARTESGESAIGDVPKCSEMTETVVVGPAEPYMHTVDGSAPAHLSMDHPVTATHPTPPVLPERPGWLDQPLPQEPVVHSEDESLLSVYGDRGDARLFVTAVVDQFWSYQFLKRHSQHSLDVRRLKQQLLGSRQAERFVFVAADIENLDGLCKKVSQLGWEVVRVRVNDDEAKQQAFTSIVHGALDDPNRPDVARVLVLTEDESICRALPADARLSQFAEIPNPPFL
ncbi:MAG: hypothetical protein R2735_04405 [Microthrixaceae bacterium]